MVEISGLHFSYPNGTPALNGIDLRVRRGEAVAIIGANGAGKSTLLQHLNGYLTSPTGEIRIGEVRLSKTTVALVRRSVGMVFQDPEDQLFMPTVEEDVAFGPRNLGLAEAAVSERVTAALRQVDAAHLRRRSPHHLSLGEKRAVALASVLSMAPDILVLDEPTSGLDPRTRRQLISWLKGFEQTRIIASHDLDLVLDLCPRAIVIHEGRIMADGASRDIFRDSELLARSHLEQPLRLQGCPVCGAT